LVELRCFGRFGISGSPNTLKKEKSNGTQPEHSKTKLT